MKIFVNPHPLPNPFLRFASLIAPLTLTESLRNPESYDDEKDDGPNCVFEVRPFSTLVTTAEQDNY